MSTSSLGYRLSATTGIHRGDRAYQQDQVQILPHARVPGCVMGVLADGIVGKSGGGQAASQVLLTGCLGTFQDPPLSQKHIDRLEIGDSVLSCSDGLWHYFTPRELGAIVHALPPREATEMLVGKARQRARGSGDNLSLALVRVEPLA